ncbi:SDR family oxidoreductase [Nocardia puris]|uniref:SDR family oxidoreductase n=1 Tax=Nocardia puris TaxID=208602 RepID=UPI0018DE3041|nr:SDR family oxidoreductase [Nocardia puris]
MQPGGVRGQPQKRHIHQSLYDQIAQDYPVGRIVRAEEMAAVAMFLASDDAGAVLGHDLDASGGYLTG